MRTKTSFTCDTEQRKGLEILLDCPCHISGPKGTVFELAHYGLFVAAKENDYLLAHSFQSLIVTLVIRIAAPRSHLAFRFARSRRMAVITLWLPRCTLAISQPIA